MKWQPVQNELPKGEVLIWSEDRAAMALFSAKCCLATAGNEILAWPTHWMRIHPPEQLSSTLRRRADQQRLKVLMRGGIITQWGRTEVAIHNMSPSGALISTSFKLVDGADVVFQRAGVFVAARVTWIQGTTAGLTFYRDLTDEELKSVMNRVVVFTSAQTKKRSPDQSIGKASMRL